MYDAAAALRDAMIELGLACDGGKDSLSMAAGAGGEVCPLPCLCLPEIILHCSLPSLIMSIMIWLLKSASIQR